MWLSNWAEVTELPNGGMGCESRPLHPQTRALNCHMQLSARGSFAGVWPSGDTVLTAPTGEGPCVG